MAGVRQKVFQGFRLPGPEVLLPDDSHFDDVLPDWYEDYENENEVPLQKEQEQEQEQEEEQEVTSDHA